MAIRLVGPGGPTSISVTRLLDACRQGDDDAATELFEYYFEILRKHANTVLPGGGVGGQGASDAAQMALAEVLSTPDTRERQLQSIDCGEHLMCVLIRRTKDRARDIIKKATRKKRGGEHAIVSLDGITPEVLGPTAREIAPEIQALLREEVAEWLKRLDDTSRSVVQLVLDGYNVAQIADRFDESRQWVEKTYQASLRSFLEMSSGPRKPR